MSSSSTAPRSRRCFRGAGSTPSPPLPRPALRFGSSVAAAGDVDGDGLDDVVVGAPRYDKQETDEGGVFVYSGSNLFVGGPILGKLRGTSAGAQFGYSVAGAGDVNGDGYADVIVGAPFYDNGHTDEGRAFIYYGGTGGLDPTRVTTLESDQTRAYFGSSVAGAGDVNGDGYSDVVIGAWAYDGTIVNEGRVSGHGPEHQRGLVRARHAEQRCLRLFGRERRRPQWRRCRRRDRRRAEPGVEQPAPGRPSPRLPRHPSELTLPTVIARFGLPRCR